MEFLIEHKKNKKGRDFVVSDLHGCYNQLCDLLDFVSFNPITDRLFSVGDLINRGPYSIQCLSLINEPWFYPIAGNHENMLIEASKSRSGLINLYNCQGTWSKPFFDSNSKSFKKLLSQVENLPLVRIVETDTKPIVILHAEPYKNLVMTLENLRSGVIFKEEKFIESVQWSRTVFGKISFGFYDKDQIIKRICEVPDIKNQTLFKRDDFVIVSGHTPLASPVMLGNHLCLESAAFRNTPMQPQFGLSMYEVGTDKVHKYISPVRIISYTPIKVSLKDLEYI